MNSVSKEDNKIDAPEKKSKVNSYFLVLSGRFKTAKYISVCVLVVFLLSTILLFRDEVTVENLRYLIKDFEMGDSINLSSDDKIKYDVDTQLDLDMYKGDLVVAGSSYFYLCDLQGNKRLNEESVFTNPVVVSSDKYLLVYGLSEYTYTLYNTFSKLHTETFDYPITGAAVSDKGLYAIVTRTTEYRSVVYLYNSSFERIGAVYKDKYIMDVSFNHDGSELLITSIYSKNGNYCTEILNYVPYSDKPNSVKEVEGSMVIKSGYHSDGSFSVLYDNKIEFYNKASELKNIYEFPSGIVPVDTDITSIYTAITYTENIVGDNMKVIVFNSNGEIILDADAEGQPVKLTCSDKYAFVLLNGRVCKIDIESGETVYYDTAKNAIELLVVNDKSLLVCFADGTLKINY